MRLTPQTLNPSWLIAGSESELSNSLDSSLLSTIGFSSHLIFKCAIVASNRSDWITLIIYECCNEIYPWISVGV